MKKKTKGAFGNKSAKQPVILCYAVITNKKFSDMEMICPLYEGINISDYKKTMEENKDYSVKFVDDISEEDKRDLNSIEGDGVFLKDV